jgi:hypothetical protein
LHAINAASYMATTRNKRPASDMIGPALPPAPTKRGCRPGIDCQTDWEDFCSRAEIPCGSTGPKSPEKTKTPLEWVQTHHQQVFFLTSDLERETFKSEVLLCLPRYISTDARIAHLRSALKEGVARFHPIRNRSAPDQVSSSNTARSNDVQGRSPSKHLKQTQLDFSVTKSQQARSKPDDVVFARPRSPVKETSFTTTTANTSFWSNAPSSSAESATTLVDSSDDDAFEPIPSPSKGVETVSSSGRMGARLRAIEKIEPQVDDREPSAHAPDMFISSLDSDDFVLLDQLTEKGQGLLHASDRFARLEKPPLSGYNKFSFALRWEVQRVLQLQSVTGDSTITAQDLQRNWRRPHTLQSLYSFVKDRSLGLEPGFTDEQNPDSEQMTLYARLEPIASSSGPMFRMVLRHPVLETACDLQRRFGWDNVLYVDTPSLTKPTGHHKGRRLLEQFRETFRASWELMGRKWQLLSVQAIKKKSVPNAHASEHRLILVALGEHLTTEMFQSLLEYDANSHQPAAKLYSRIDLAASRPTCVIRLEPADISYDVPDKLANRDPDDTRYLDPKFQNLAHPPFDADTVVNDGCNIMSPWLASVFLDVAGESPDRRGFQGRIAGAKGIWIPDGDPYQADPANKPAGPHLYISKSQIKVRLPCLLTCNPAYLNFNLVRTNASARPSVLHLGYLPILLDRGVERQTIIEIVTVQVQAKVDRIVEAVRDGPEAVRVWLNSKNDMLEARNREQGMSQVAGFPIRNNERVVQMLEAGFDPMANKFLAQQLQEAIAEIMTIENKRFQIPLGRSTTLLGVPDPKDCLLPGEVHINFAARFVDPVSGESYQMLHGRDVLVARNPSMGSWDIQRVRCVFKPELAHLTDTIVFPTRGPVPLASKLSGGDYDGDTFWICFEPKIVNKFKNAPVPCPWPSYEELGIRKKKEMLYDYVSDPTSEAQWRTWALEMASTRLEGSFLGPVSLLYERLIYDQGAIDSEQAQMLVFLHDYLVDADKQGYEFTQNDLDKFTTKYGISKQLCYPEYWRLTKEEKTDYSNQAPVKDNIIDTVLFGVVSDIHEKCLVTIRELLGTAQSRDQHLEMFHDQIMNSNASNHHATFDGTFKAEIEHLRSSLKLVREAYTTKFPGMSSHSSHTDYIDRVKELRAMYDAIQPLQPEHPAVREWLRHQGASLSIWEKLKASTLAKHHHDTIRPGKLLFNLAGRELCELKTNETAQAELELFADHGGAPRVVSKRQWSLMKPRKTKRTQAAQSHMPMVRDGSDDEFMLEDTDDCDYYDFDHVP